MLEDQNPLKTQLEKSLNESEWMQKFKALSELLQTLKREVPLTQLCKLKWDTTHQSLLIHCPNIETRKALASQANTLAQLSGCARQIFLKYAEQPDLVIEPAELNHE